MIPATASEIPKMARPMPASPQAISSITTGINTPGRVTEGVGHEIERVEADPGSFLDDRPRRLFSFVPLVGGGADHSSGEVVHPLPDLQVLVVEGEGKAGGWRRGA